MMTTTDKITVYTPESPLREPGKLLRGMFRDLIDSRELAWRLFVRNNTAQYRQTVLGYLWAFLPPIATSLTWVFLAKQRVLNVGNPGGIPYPAFVIIGITLWQTFVDALNTPMRMMQDSRQLLTKINFPREALLLAGLGGVLFNFCVRSILLVGTMIWFQLPIHSTVALAPLGALCLIGFGMTLGLLLTPVSMLFQDVGRALGLFTGFWMLLTPIVYPVPRTGLGVILAQWNPVSPLITCTREWLTLGSASHQSAFLWVTVFTLVMLCFGWLLYRVTMPIIIERLGS